MFPVSSQYLSAIRDGGAYTVKCDTYRDGLLVPGGRNLIVDSGSVTDDSTPGVRRQLDVGLSPDPGKTVQTLFDLLAPIGTELRVRSLYMFPNRSSVEVVPMGVFDIDAEKMSYGPGGTLTVQASDKWVRIQRARFLAPFASTPGITVKAQIAALIRGALGSAEPVTITATSTATMGSVVWERDRDKAIIELAESIGAWCYFDRNGVATVANTPTAAVPVWNVTDGADANLMAADRSRDRSKTYNVVVVNSEVVDDVPLFPPRYVWDNDNSSPTFAASGSGSGATPPDPNTAGAFGLVPYFYSSPLLRDAGQGLAAGATILSRVKGLNAQLRMTTTPNHALDSFDGLAVQLPRARSDSAPPIEVHTADKVVHPLTPDGLQTIATRSTRTDEEASL